MDTQNNTAQRYQRPRPMQEPSGCILGCDLPYVRGRNRAAAGRIALRSRGASTIRAMEQTIRLLTPDDAPNFLALRLRGLRECPDAFAASPEEEEHRSPENVRAWVQSTEAGAIIGAFEREAGGAELLVGLAGVHREEMIKLRHKAILWGMYVAPESRGRGIGMAVLAFALEHAARVLRVRQVNLGVNTRNAAAIALYRKAGFEEYGIEKGFLFVDGVYHDEYQMVCRVDDR